MDTQRYTGGCLCGRVRYTYTGTLRPVVACHCEQCRRTSGHFVAATQGRRGQLRLEDPGHALRWYESSPGVRRGFCGVCGASILWERQGSGRISIMAGTLDAPTGLRLVQHIYTAYAGDYYTIDPAAAQAPEGAELPGIPGHAHDD
ncbi:MAG: GFA family protein [Halofilum sp. (in: g-proteobacteria)]|nr:GFA family protein [Halofilum sp. (in: g-proteobacteria)]